MVERESEKWASYYNSMSPYKINEMVMSQHLRFLFVQSQSLVQWRYHITLPSTYF